MDEEATLASLKRFGATPEELEKARANLVAKRETQQYGVWPENWRAFELFTACATQWHREIAPTGRIVWHGLPTERIESTGRRCPPAPGTEVPDPRELFYQLQQLEREALQHLNSSG